MVTPFTDETGTGNIKFLESSIPGAISSEMDKRFEYNRVQDERSKEIYERFLKPDRPITRDDLEKSAFASGGGYCNLRILQVF